MHPVYDEMIEVKEHFNDDALNDGEHQANAIPADVDWELLHKDSKTLTLSTNKNGKKH
jgi:hypothetical protein